MASSSGAPLTVTLALQKVIKLDNIGDDSTMLRVSVVYSMRPNSLMYEVKQMGYYLFDNRDDLSAFVYSDKASQSGKITYSGPDVQELSKAMYEASKLRTNKQQSFAKGGAAMAVPGIGFMVGAVAAPIAVPGFLVAYYAANYFNKKSHERIEAFKSGFPFGKVSWRLLELGWEVTANDVKSIELYK